MSSPLLAALFIVRLHAIRFSENDSASALGIHLDNTLAGQTWAMYELKQHISFWPLERNNHPLSSSSFVEAREAAIPKETMRASLDAQWHVGTELGSGAFGVAYRAIRKHEPSKTYVLKFIYQHSAGGGMGIVTATDAASDDTLAKKLHDLDEECEYLDRSQKAAGQNSVGASRLIACHDRCLKDTSHPKKRKCTEAAVNASLPQFIVMDDGGENGAEWMRKAVESGRSESIAVVLRQVAEGLDYMTRNLSPPIIHHDLKWDNIAVSESHPGELHTKLIDFGEAVEVDPTHEAKPQKTSTLFPPEHELGYAYFGPPSAFDVYSLGFMALQSLCGVSVPEIMSKLRMPSAKLLQHQLKIGLTATSNCDSCGPDEFDWAMQVFLHLAASSGGNVACALSMAKLVDPNPHNRLQPHAISFATNFLVDSS